MQDERDKVDGIVVVPEQSEKYLNQRQLEDYTGFRKQLLKWLLNLGKDPEMAEGYAFDTVRQRSYKLDQFYRWIWRQEDGYTLRVTTDHADTYCKELVYEELSKTHKAAVQKAIKSLFKYLNHERGRSIDWEPEIKFSSGGATHQIRDFLTGDERRKIKQASLEYGSIPHYNSLDPRERDEWNRLHIDGRGTTSQGGGTCQNLLVGPRKRNASNPERGVHEEYGQLARRSQRTHIEHSPEMGE